MWIQEVWEPLWTLDGLDMNKEACTCNTWEVANVFRFVSFSETLGLRFHTYTEKERRWCCWRSVQTNSRGASCCRWNSDQKQEVWYQAKTFVSSTVKNKKVVGGEWQGKGHNVLPNVSQISMHSAQILRVAHITNRYWARALRLWAIKVWTPASPQLQELQKNFRALITNGTVML